MITKGVFFKVTPTIWIMYFVGDPTYSHANKGGNARPYRRTFFLYYIRLRCIIIFCIGIYYIFYCATLKYIILYYTALYYIAFLRAILYCVILFYVTTPSAHPSRKRSVFNSKDTPPGGWPFRVILRAMGPYHFSAIPIPGLIPPAAIHPAAVVIHFERYAV